MAKQADGIDDIIEWILEPFKKKMRWKGILKNWLLFLFAGFVVMGFIQYFGRYDFAEADMLTSETGVGCDRIAMLVLVVLPPIEELLFRIVPYHYMGRNAAFCGTVLWASLHLFGRNFAIVGFQMVMGIFYFKLVTSRRYKESIILHEIFNFVPLLTCFFF